MKAHVARFTCRWQQPPACYRLPGGYPDRTYTGRRRRAPDQVMIAEQPSMISGRTGWSTTVTSTRSGLEGLTVVSYFSQNPQQIGLYPRGVPGARNAGAGKREKFHGSYCHQVYC